MCAAEYRCVLDVFARHASWHFWHWSLDADRREM
jgi:hypothetical protein